MVPTTRDTNIPTFRRAGGVVNSWSLAMDLAAIDVKLDSVEALVAQCLTLVRNRKARLEAEPRIAQEPPVAC